MKRNGQCVEIAICAVLTVLAQPKVRGHIPLGTFIGSDVWLRSRAKVDKHKPPRAGNQNILWLDVVVEDRPLGPIIRVLVK